MIVGPKFLWEPDDTRNKNIKVLALNTDNSELKRDVHVNQIVVGNDVLSILENYATWSTIFRVIALIIRFIKNLKYKTKKGERKTSDEGTALSTTTMIQEARALLINWLNNNTLKKNSNC